MCIYFPLIFPYFYYSLLSTDTFLFHFVRNREREEKIKNAVEAVRNGMAKKAAAKSFGIARSTIQYRLSEKFKSPGYGPPTILTSEEEDILVRWIFECHRKGFPRRIDDIQSSVQELIRKDKRKTPFKNEMPGKGWYKAFLRRHPEVTERTSEAVTAASSPISEKDIRKWFSFIDSYFNEEGYKEVFNNPSRIFNGDETNFLLCPKNKKVLAPKGCKNIYEIDQGLAKTSLTVMFTFGADGSITPPMIIYPYKKNVPKDIADTVPEEWGIGHSDNGWMKSEVFVDYILNIFNPYLIKNNIIKPVVLFLDGHRTHLTLELSELCSKLKIIIVCLYPNATRILQPADVAAFKPLKTGWLKAMISWRRCHPNIQFTKANFAPLLVDVIKNYLKPQTIINGFRATGIYPWNADAIDYSKCLGGQCASTSNFKEKEICHSRQMSINDFREIAGEEIMAKIESENIDDNSQVLKKLYHFFRNEDNQDSVRNEAIDATVIIDLDVSNIENNIDNTLREDTQLFEELSKFDELMDTLKEERISAVESSPVASCSNALQEPCSPPNLSKLLYWPQTPIRKNIRNTERKHFVVTSEEFQKQFKTKEEIKKKLEEEKLKKREFREQKKKETANSKKSTKVRILSNVEIASPAKRKKITKVTGNLLSEKSEYDASTPMNKSASCIGLPETGVENIKTRKTCQNISKELPSPSEIELKDGFHILEPVIVAPPISKQPDGITDIHLPSENSPQILSEISNTIILPFDLPQPPVVLPETLDLEVLEPEFPDRKEKSKYINHQSKLQSGICFTCTFNINKRNTGLKCLKCTRTYHYRCFKGENSVCPKCI